MRLPGAYYPRWRMVRIWAILDRYGAEAFREKTVLEVGCGDGSIGNFFYYLGAHVTCVDARQEFVDEVEYRNHEIRTACCDLNVYWPFPDEQFDFVLHLGVLYHLEKPQFAIEQACKHSKHLVLDCEVTNNEGYAEVLMKENPPERAEHEGDDHAWSEGNMGCRPTPSFIERAIEDSGMVHEMLMDDKYDKFHPTPQSLAWSEGLRGYTNGQRRMWFCSRMNP